MLSGHVVYKLSGKGAGPFIQVSRLMLPLSARRSHEVWLTHSPFFLAEPRRSVSVVIFISGELLNRKGEACCKKFWELMSDQQSRKISGHTSHVLGPQHLFTISWARKCKGTGRNAHSLPKLRGCSEVDCTIQDRGDGPEAGFPTWVLGLIAWKSRALRPSQG